MARTVNARLRTIRRDAFLDAAERLIQAKGYDGMSVQDVLGELDASKGAFYHYFDSKHALLEAVVDRFADNVLAALAPVMDDPDLPALRKMERVFSGIARLKAQRKELVLAVTRVWYSDANAIVREKLRRMTARRLIPFLSAVVSQGIAEGTLSADLSPEGTAGVLVSILQGGQEVAVELLMARQAGAVTFEAVQRAMGAYTEAYERILGIPKGSLTLNDEPTLRFWFG